MRTLLKQLYEAWEDQLFLTKVSIVALIIFLMAIIGFMIMLFFMFEDLTSGMVGPT